MKICSKTGFKPTTCGLPNRGAFRKLCYASLQRLCRHTTSARHGQLQGNEKEPDYWIELLPLRTFFDFLVTMAQKWWTEHTTNTTIDLKKETVFWEEKVVVGDLDRTIQANLKSRARYFSIYESYSSMKASTHNLMKEIETVVFETDEMEHRDKSELNALLPRLCNQDSKSDVEISY